MKLINLIINPFFFNKDIFFKNCIVILLSLSFVMVPIGIIDFPINITVGRLSFVFLLIIAFQKIYKIELNNIQIKIYIASVLFLFSILISNFYNFDILFNNFFLRWLSAFVAIFLLPFLFNGNNKKYLINSIFLAAIIFIVYSIYNGYLIILYDYIVNNIGSPRTSSLSSGPNIFGMMGSLFLSIILFYKKINKTTLFSIIFLSFLILIFSGSKSNQLISLAILFICFFRFRVHSRLLIIIISFYIIFITYLNKLFIIKLFSDKYKIFENTNSISDRVSIYKEIYTISEFNFLNSGFYNILFGWGADTQKEFIYFGHTHNWILDLYIQIGIIGLLIFCYIIFLFYRFLLNSKSNKAFIYPLSVLLIANLSSGSFASSSITYLIFILSLSMIYKRYEKY